ncbi:MULTISPECIES: hypothetical protein [unclassified Microcoleus]|uniref:hypothetical protein n=1 Tax=unclassified Microcoleus TaxID=2642155 RepID=UPI002FD0A377
MGLSSRYIFNLDKFSLETLVEISPLGLGRECYSQVFGIATVELRELRLAIARVQKPGFLRNQQAATRDFIGSIRFLGFDATV